MVKVYLLISPHGNPVSVPVAGSLQMNNSLVLREALLQGAGNMLTPTFIVGTDLQAGRLHAVLQDYKALEVSNYTVYPQQRHLSPKVRAFIDFLLERFAEPVYWDQWR